MVATTTTTAIESPSPPNGRERAIETLIDLEPHGAFYRAARVMDEAVPQALASRPNLVTKAALVEQAYEMQPFEISSREKYDAVFGPKLKTTATASASPLTHPSPAPSSAALSLFISTPSHHSSSLSSSSLDHVMASLSSSTEEQERILRHHAKIVSFKRGSSRVGSSSGNSAVAATTTPPPPQLVAALRRVYGSDEGNNNNSNNNIEAPAFLLRSLLKSVMNHKAFNVTDSQQQQQGDDNHQLVSAAVVKGDDVVVAAGPSLGTSTRSTGGDKCDDGLGGETDVESAGIPLTAHLELLIGNVCQVACSTDNRSSSQVLQGLLIAALSVLMSCSEEYASSFADDDDGGLRKAKAGKARPALKTSSSSSRNSTSSSSPGEDPVMPSLQVGGVLSLIKPAALEDDRSSSAFHLDAEVLSYLGQVSAIYEERIEIHKARLLARRQAEKEDEDAKLKETEVTTTVPQPSMASAEISVGESGDEEVAEEGSVRLIPAETAASNTATVEIGDSTSNNAGRGIDMASGSESAEQARDAVAIVQEDEDDDDEDDDDEHRDSNPQQQQRGLSLLEDEAAAISAAVFEQIISSAATGEETSSNDDAALEEGSSESEESEDSEDDEDDDDEDDDEDDHSDDTMAGYEAVGDGDEEARRMLEEDAHEDESSSSESSVDDEMEANAMMMEGEAASDGDEEDDVMLRQALALSLVEHSRGAAEEGQQQGEATVAARNVSECHEEAPAASSIEISAQQHEEAVSQSVEATKQTQDDKDPADSDRDLPGEPPLPAIPKPPRSYPYAAFLLSVDSEETPAISDDVSYLDPASFVRFGLLPSGHVLVHLLRYIITIIERRKLASSGGGHIEASSTVYPPPLPGGMGVTLFSPKLGKVSKGTMDAQEVAVSLQLLVAFLLLISEKRDHAISSLIKAIAMEQHVVQEVGLQQQQTLDEDESDGTPLSSEEEDDPAMALAMNYMNESAAEASESLEAKGMRRKAAAAAHDAAVLMKSHRRRTEAWKQKVKLYSHCTIMAVRNLKLFLRSIVRQSLSDWVMDRSGLFLSVADCHDFLPSSTAAKLVNALVTFSSLGGHRSLSTALGGDGTELDDLCAPLKLYQEAISTWGECLPLVYPSPAEQSDLLSSLIVACSSSGADQCSYPRSPESITILPSLDLEIQQHRLQVLCRRLRVRDLLDGFVSRPICLLQEGRNEDGGFDGLHDDDKENIRSVGELRIATHILAYLYGAYKDIGGMKGEVQRFYLALCHKCNERVLLWDGLYAQELEGDDLIGSISVSPAIATGDLVRVSASPSSNLQFDATKCSDSIAIIPNPGEPSSAANGSSVLQRASKVWGTVLSSTHFNPKTGVHRWAVRLDKCERGHVFVGVATAQSSMRTYVGGDKYGWGVIGTQALWHDRRKIRGDYGATFRSGSTIIVTLDTDAGTLSFSSWKDSNLSNSFSLDPMLQSMSSPRRHGQVGGTVEDWGIAFEGLPLDSRLYPAVGLYQRDDRVTILNVESGGVSTSRDGLIDGSCSISFYPPSVPANANQDQRDRIDQVRRYNSLLSWDGVQYVSHILKQVAESDEAHDNEFLLTSLLPSVAASLCLVPPNLPVLSSRFALAILPSLRKCIQQLEKLRGERQMVHRLFRHGLREGKWVIRATGSSSPPGGTECEEYVVDLTTVANDHGTLVGFEGTGVGTTGKSKNGLVAIFGTFKGSSLHFVEEWTEGGEDAFSVPVQEDALSSCVVTARLSLDGKKFEGTYRNVQFGTAGRIAGILCSDRASMPKLRLKESPPASSKQSAELTSAIVSCEALLCLAHSHLVTSIGEDAAGDNSFVLDIPEGSLYSASQWCSQRNVLSNFIVGSFLSQASIFANASELAACLGSVKRMYSAPMTITSSDNDPIFLLDSMIQEISRTAEANFRQELTHQDLLSMVERLDAEMSNRTGGRGSLSVLAADQYKASRHLIICALVRLCNMHATIVSADSGSAGSSSGYDKLNPIWTAALKIMEDGVRRTLVSEANRPSKQKMCLEVCERFDFISRFILSLGNVEAHGQVAEIVNEVSSLYDLVKNKVDVEYLAEEMKFATKRALLRLVATREAVSLLSNNGSTNLVIESPVALEAIVLCVARLLGHGQTVASVHGEPRLTVSSEDLGVHYSWRLSGSPRVMNQYLQQHVSQLFRNLGEALKTAVRRRSASTTSESLVSIDSLVLSLLTSFTITLGPEDIDDAVVASAFMETLPAVLAAHRSALANDQPAGTKQENSKSALVRDLQEICQRDISRCVLRAAVAAELVLTYQSSRRLTSQSSASALCIQVALAELAVIVPLFEDFVKDARLAASVNLQNEQWERLFESSSLSKISGSSPVRSPGPNQQVGRSGVAYLWEHGTLLTHSPQPPSQRPSSRTSGNSASVPGSTTVKTMMSLPTFCHQYLSQWLHVISAVLKSPSLPSILKDARATDFLLGVVGISVVRDEELNIVDVTGRHGDAELLPGRYRARILRLILPLLANAKPSSKIVRGLLVISGVTSNVLVKGVSNEESVVSCEVISLLRELHAPSRPAWRAMVNESIHKALLNKERELSDLHWKTGALIFFSGNIGLLSRGSYVLLKPSAAMPLSIDQQSSPSSKAHAGSSGGGSGSNVGATPNHVVGSGTEGIVAGLCRADASAGIVSNIDLKNGLCEVILLSRRHLEQDSSGSIDGVAGTSDPSFPSKGRPNRGARPGLKVRALRTPLSDVVQAQEVPIHLDDSVPFGILFSELLNTMAGLDEDREGPAAPNTDVSRPPRAEKNNTQMMNLALVTLRACITVLSDKGFISNFLDNDSTRETFAKVLSVACPGDEDAATHPESISPSLRDCLASLPGHEARYCHLVSLLREVSIRLNIAKEIPRFELEKRLAVHRHQGDKTVAVSSSEMEGHKTPLVEVGSIPTTPPPLATAAGGISRESSGVPDNASRQTSQSSTGNNDNEDEEESEAAATAAAHLREAAIAQMAELGLPRSWSELALRRTGGTNIEAAVHFCLERGGEMERLLAEERERERMVQRQSSGGSSSRRRGNREESGTSNQLLRQLLEMGFPSRWCAEALAATGNNVDEALTWILTNGERLSAEDEGMDEGDGSEEEQSEEEEEEEEESVDELEGADVEPRTEGITDASSQSAEVDTKTGMDAEGACTKGTDAETKPVCGWSGSIIPLRFISGRSIIDPKTLAISGLPTGGFSSVGTKGVLLSSGKWYYEAILETAGCLQIGWADGSFSGHCHADRGDGCGDGPSSWAYDGWRRYRWHATATEWGCRWKEGDVVGCLVDMDEKVVAFTLNGQAEEIGMGVAFTGEGFRPCGGVYACVSFNRREKLRLILGGSGSEPFKYTPPFGYKGVGDAVLEAVEERDALVSKEAILYSAQASSFINCEVKPRQRRFICDFSDGEHGHELMAWAHRYYGSDASVHLGSGRIKQSPGSQRSSSSSSHSDSSVGHCVIRRLEKAWSEIGTPDTTSSDNYDEEVSALMGSLTKGYDFVSEQLASEIENEGRALARLYARKLVLHLIITLGNKFDPRCFVPAQSDEISSARQLWRSIEICSSLRCAGWVGEAGAMAIAAEALGLGISSNSNSHNRHNHSERGGVVSATDFDAGVTLPAGGISQLLSTVQIRQFPDTTDTGSTLAASAEAAIGSDGGGGVLVFVKNGLQGALRHSKPLRDILVAFIRRSVRLLAVVEYDGDESVVTDNQEEEDEIERSPSSLARGSDKAREDSVDSYKDSSLPDARLVSFLTGLLLSGPVQSSIDNKAEIGCALFEAWSIGLLSASLPWRMVCAFTASGILNLCPSALSKAVTSVPILSRFYSRLSSTVARRIWAERAAVPVCSRYVQALIELIASVRHAICTELPPVWFMSKFEKFECDAATPLPIRPNQVPSVTFGNDTGNNWETDEGWVGSDAAWEVWCGTVEYMAVDWKPPSRSAVRTLMDGGEGPPLLREGCTVMRGLDWEDKGSGAKNGNEDGKDLYETEKAKREEEKGRHESPEDDDVAPVQPSECIGQAGDSPVSEDNNEGKDCEDPTEEHSPEDPAEPSTVESLPINCHPPGSIETVSQEPMKKKKKKLPSPKLPIGTVLSIEPWNGLPAMGRRVKWHLTGVEGVYRYGGDGGRFDVSHVEVNDKATRVRKRHPLPESAEQCAVRHGFGSSKKYNILLRVKRQFSEKYIEGEAERHHEGILEWPDFGAGIRVDCIMHPDGAVTLTELDLLYGSKDSGWEARFGQPSFVPGTVMVLSPTGVPSIENQADIDKRTAFLSLYDELLGSTSFAVEALRNRSTGGRIRVTSEMRLFRSKRSEKQAEPSVFSIQATLPPPIHFDRDFHAPSISLSSDCRTVSCVHADGRGTAFASVGFTKGIHYWEVKLEQADIGSVFIGVAEKPGNQGGAGSTFGHDSPPRLNRWLGWGFVNFRATYTAGAERVYGAHCHGGDTVGVLLDCDAGRVSFFFDGLKYGEHILNDLGCAFENLSPFGFNADGCGSGGAGQGAPSGIEGGRGGRYPAYGAVRPKSLWPVVGLRNPGDRVTISYKWTTNHGVDGVTVLNNVLAVDSVLFRYAELGNSNSSNQHDFFPKWFMQDAFAEYRRWFSNRYKRASYRGKMDLDLDMSPLACAAASAALGLREAYLAGDRVRLKRSAGRILELAEEATVLGAYQGRLFYRIVSQKSEGGSLTEGGGRAWCWDESEVVDGLPFIGRPRGLGVALPLLDRYRCLSPGGLKIVYEGGAVVRSDLEIFDGSVNLGTIPQGKIVSQGDVIERRVNSCGVVRYRVRYEGIGEGWISSRIRGGKEEAIVEPCHTKETKLDDNATADESLGRYRTPADCAFAWYERYKGVSGNQEAVPVNSSNLSDLEILDLESFERLAANGIIRDMSVMESDSTLANIVGGISDFGDSGDAVDSDFDIIASALSFALSSKSGILGNEAVGVPGANQMAAAKFVGITGPLPSLQAVLARVALLRALNRRARFALPWMSVRPSQEGSAILGGLYGHGASVERAGISSRHPESTDEWIETPSIAKRIRSCRGLFFTSVKRGLLQSITEATTTPTPLSHDEYELPREIRTVRINRLKARRTMLSGSADSNSKRKYSVFAQLHNETKGWGGAALRRGFVAKGHGGQKRAFKVKLIGEGVNDYSGPYREAFTDAIAELMDVDPTTGRGSLGVLDPSPNNAAAIGDNRELFMFSLNGRDLSTVQLLPSCVVSEEERRLRESFSTLVVSRDEAMREVEEALVFLGRLIGTAYRHGIPVDLALPLQTAWRAVVEEPTIIQDCLLELDYLAYKQQIQEGTSSELSSTLLWWQNRMLNSFVEGLSHVLPVEILTVFTGEELRDAFCGNPDVDVDLLQRVVEYEGYEATDPVIAFFWETLREMSNQERKAFLQFVWARNRLPMKQSEFEAPFKIQKDSSKGDDALPSASTCFFSLTLPEYSSKEILKSKLLFAIQNVTTMETDFQTNSAEIAEGYRAF